MANFTKEDIDDYQNRLTNEQSELVVRHCNKYQIKPVICAWYDDWEDFCSDWVDSLGYSKSEARKLLNNKSDNEGEFKVFKNGSIVRFEINRTRVMKKG